jgi:hypothetical protein
MQLSVIDTADRDLRSVAQAFGRARLPRNDRHRPLLLARRLHRDLDVLPGGSEKLDQAADGEIARAVAHQRGDVGLLDAEDFAGLCLGQPSSLDDLVNL